MPPKSAGTLPNWLRSRRHQRARLHERASVGGLEFAADYVSNVAVCLLPGTEIAFDENVECEPSFGTGILSNKKIGQRLARFRQVNMDNPVAHHDALEFPDGQVVLGSELINFSALTIRS